MALPAWPEGVPYAPQADGLQPIEPILDPIRTEMEGGNIRLRSRPGDNVGTLVQTIHMTFAQFDTFKAWGDSTISRWTGRFTASVWLGSAFGSKVCQFSAGAPKVSYIMEDVVAVNMTLRVFDF